MRATVWQGEEGASAGLAGFEPIYWRLHITAAYCKSDLVPLVAVPLHPAIIDTLKLST
jgi:hypothetical protein